MSVVTKDMKYIFWGYAADGFDVTEELYHLDEDPFELVNRVDNPDDQQALAEMRRAYDQRLAHWKTEAVDYNNYQPFGTIFDRNIDWSVKKKLLGKLDRGK
jgi:arylsulfatase A-like enzyme